MTIFASALLLSAHLNAFHLSETIKKVDFWGGVAYIYISCFLLFVFFGRPLVERPFSKDPELEMVFQGVPKNSHSTS